MKTNKKILTGVGIAASIALLWYAFKPKKVTVNNAATSNAGGGGGITTTLPSYVPGANPVQDVVYNNSGNCNPMFDKNCVPAGTGGVKPVRDNIYTGNGVLTTGTGDDGTMTPPILGDQSNSNSFWAGGTACNPNDKFCVN